MIQERLVKHIDRIDKKPNANASELRMVLKNIQSSLSPKKEAGFLQSFPSEEQQVINDAWQKYLAIDQQNRNHILLAVIDPIRAFSENGIYLSASVQKSLVKRYYRPRQLRNIKPFYDAVKAGKVTFPWIKDIRLQPKDSGN